MWMPSRQCTNNERGRANTQHKLTRADRVTDEWHVDVCEPRRLGEDWERW